MILVQLHPVIISGQLKILNLAGYLPQLLAGQAGRKGEVGRQEVLGIGMLGIGKELVSWRQLDQGSLVEDGDPLGKVSDHCQIMGDKEVRKVKFLLQVCQKLQNLGLNGHIQGRCRLVTDHKLGTADYGTSNANPLALAATKGFGPFMHSISSDAHSLQNRQGHLLSLLLGPLVKGFLDQVQGR